MDIQEKMQIEERLWKEKGFIIKGVMQRIASSLILDGTWALLATPITSLRLHALRSPAAVQPGHTPQYSSDLDRMDATLPFAIISDTQRTLWFEWVFLGRERNEPQTLHQQHSHFFENRKTLAYISGHAHAYEHFLERDKNFLVAGGFTRVEMLGTTIFFRDPPLGPFIFCG